MLNYTATARYDFDPDTQFPHSVSFHLKIEAKDLYMPSVRDRYLQAFRETLRSNKLVFTDWRSAYDIFVFAFHTKSDATMAKLLIAR